MEYQTRLIKISAGETFFGWIDTLYGGISLPSRSSVLVLGPPPTGLYPTLLVNTGPRPTSKETEANCVDNKEFTELILLVQFKRRRISPSTIWSRPKPESVVSYL